MEETLEHRIWSCPCNVGKPAYDHTQHLMGPALAEVESQRSLWLGGVNPAANAIPTVQGQDTEQLVTIGDVKDVSHGLPLFVFGDASGGGQAEDPRQRRVG